MANNATWMVRAGEGAYLAEEFLEKRRVCIGWAAVGDLRTVKDITDLRARYKKGISSIAHS